MREGPEAAWALRQAVHERDSEVPAQGRDGSGAVPLRSDRLSHVAGSWAAARVLGAGAASLEGKSGSARRPGSHRPRCTRRRDGGSRASRGPRSGASPAPASAPRSHARSASAAWRWRPGLRAWRSRAGSRASTWSAPSRPRATRLEAVMDLYAGEPQMSGHEHCPQAVPVRCL
jgi:hypothetical protein